MFQQGETAPDDKGQGPSLKAILGAKAHEALSQGLEVDADTTAALMADTIRSLNSKPAEDSKLNGGWILVDYPKTKSQALSLERELSGYSSLSDSPDSYPTIPQCSIFTFVPTLMPTSNPSRYEDPKLVTKAANTKRPGGKDSAPKEKAKPVVARPTSQDGPSSGESIVDAILFLEVANDTAVQRAAGRRMDPVTGKAYHVEFDPPPAEEPVLSLWETVISSS